MNHSALLQLEFKSKDLRQIIYFTLMILCNHTASHSFCRIWKANNHHQTLLLPFIFLTIESTFFINLNTLSRIAEVRWLKMVKMKIEMVHDDDGGIYHFTRDVLLVFYLCLLRGQHSTSVLLLSIGRCIPHSTTLMYMPTRVIKNY